MLNQRIETNDFKNDIMKSKSLLCLLVLTFLAFQLPAQELTLFGELRPRGEYRDGYAKPIITSNRGGFFIKQRTRLGANFTNWLLTMEVTFQDSRVWGDSADDTDNPSIGLYEAWAKINILPGFTVKIGRQSLQYDNRKLFDPGDWTDSGNSFDMILLKYNLNDDFMVDAGFSYNNNSDISQETYYQSAMKFRFMEMLWISKKITDDMRVTAIGAVLANQDTIKSGGSDNYNTYHHYHQATIGGTFRYEPRSFPLKFMAEGYYQFGKVVYKNALDKLKSFYIVGNISYQVLPFLGIAGGYEYISGDRNPENGIQRGFLHLFGDTHDFNGTMDYWTNTGERGLQDIYIGTLWEFNKKKTSVEAIYHHFKTAVQTSGLNGKKLGNELDFIIKHEQTSWLKFELGYNFYFVNDNVKILKGIQNEKTRLAQWFYLNISIKPSVVLALAKKKD